MYPPKALAAEAGETKLQIPMMKPPDPMRAVKTGRADLGS
jgi:hypothetical protein